jgi:hypothetical protein
VFVLAIGSNKKQTKASLIFYLSRWSLLRRDFGCFYCAYLGGGGQGEVAKEQIAKEKRKALDAKSA